MKLDGHKLKLSSVQCVFWWVEQNLFVIGAEHAIKKLAWNNILLPSIALEVKRQIICFYIRILKNFLDQSAPFDQQ